MIPKEEVAIMLRNDYNLPMVTRAQGIHGR